LAPGRACAYTLHIIERIHARGAMIKVLDKPHLDLTTPIGRGFIAFLSALAKDERQRIVKLANASVHKEAWSPARQKTLRKRTESLQRGERRCHYETYAPQ